MGQSSGPDRAPIKPDFGDQATKSPQDPAQRSELVHQSTALLNSRDSLKLPDYARNSVKDTPQLSLDLSQKGDKSETNSQIKDQNMADTDAKLDRLINKSAQEGSSKIEQLPSTKSGVSEFKITYPKNAEGKSPAIKLGLNEKGELVKIGDKLAKDKDGWHTVGPDGKLGPKTTTQNYSFDLETGRYTYQTDQKQGKWMDLNGDKGKVNVHSNNALAYLDTAGKHEYTVRPDGSILDAKTHTTTKQIQNGEQEITHMGKIGTITKSADGTIRRAGNLEYQWGPPTEDPKDRELLGAKKMIGGKSTDIQWNKDSDNPDKVRVLAGGEFEIIKFDGAKETIGRDLVTRHYAPGQENPNAILKPNGDRRDISSDGTIVDKFAHKGINITRTITPDGRLITNIDKTLARPHTQPRESIASLSADSQTKVDRDGNVKISSQNEKRIYYAHTATMNQVRAQRSRTR